jgi:hypothetical protein
MPGRLQSLAPKITIFQAQDYNVFLKRKQGTKHVNIFEEKTHI